jgi:hypothetical protein
VLSFWHQVGENNANIVPLITFIREKLWKYSFLVLLADRMQKAEEC